MDDSTFIQRRCEELDSLSQQLHADLEAIQAQLVENEADLKKWLAYQDDIRKLRGARRGERQPRVPKPQTAPEPQGEAGKTTVPEMIEKVLKQHESALRPVEIKRIIESEWPVELHNKHVASECNQLHLKGRLLKDEFAPLYSLPPELGSDETMEGQSLPYQSPAKGREAVPGGVN